MVSFLKDLATALYGTSHAQCYELRRRLKVSAGSSPGEGALDGSASKARLKFVTLGLAPAALHNSQTCDDAGTPVCSKYRTQDGEGAGAFGDRSYRRGLGVVCRYKSHCSSSPVV